MKNSLDIMSVINTIVDFYNNEIFGVGIVILILYFIFVGYKLYMQNKINKKKSWYHLIGIIKIRTLKVVFLLMAFGGIILFINNFLLFDILKLLHLKKYWKIYVTTIVLINIYFGEMHYRELDLIEALYNITHGKYNHRSSKNILLDLIDSNENNYLIKEKKLDLLKSLAPVSLVPPFVGYILEGNDIVINWNWYTVTLIIGLLFYFLYICKCYIEMKFDSRMLLYIKSELREVESKENS